MSSSLPHVLIRDCMAPTLITVGPYDSLARAYELMMAHRIRRLPVVDGAKLAGIITLTDVLEAKQSDPAHRRSLEEVARELGKLLVGTQMTRDPVCVYDNDTVGHAAELMLDRKIGGLPVIDADGGLCGVVTASDLFRLLAERWRSDNVGFSGARPG